MRLTLREGSVLAALIAARGRVLPKATLSAFEDGIAGDAVEIYVSRLRVKLGPTSS